MYKAQLNHTYYYSKLITLKKENMKHFFKLVILASVITSLTFGISAFGSVKKTKSNEDSNQIAKSYQRQQSIN
jgi:hypothetical protein